MPRRRRRKPSTLLPTDWLFGCPDWFAWLGKMQIESFGLRCGQAKATICSNKQHTERYSTSFILRNALKSDDKIKIAWHKQSISITSFFTAWIHLNLKNGLGYGDDLDSKCHSYFFTSNTHWVLKADKPIQTRVLIGSEVWILKTLHEIEVCKFFWIRCCWIGGWNIKLKKLRHFGDSLIRL